jgi:hypothetical protein
MQQVVNAPPTAGEGARTARMTSALVSAGLDAGYLTNPRLAKVHWQAAGRTLPAPAACPSRACPARRSTGRIRLC